MPISTPESIDVGPLIDALIAEGIGSMPQPALPHFAWMR